jgi:hypothetical protein
MVIARRFAIAQFRSWRRFGFLAAGSLLFATWGSFPLVAQTPTDTPTPTVTVTATTTGTPTATASPTQTVTQTATATPSVTQTQTATQTATLTPAVTITSTVTQTPTLTPPVSGTPTVTQTGTLTPPVTATQTVTPTLTRTGTVTPGTSTPTGTPGTSTPTRTRTQEPHTTRTATPTETPLPVTQVLAGYIPVVGSIPGNFGSFFKTSVQLLNPGASTSTGRLVFHPAGTSGQPTDPSQSWTLGPGQIVSYPDVGTALGQSGLGSVDVYVGEGQPLPVVITRIFNDAGAGGTSGFTEPFFRTSDVPDHGSGFLIGPSDVAQFRYNIGIRTLDSPVSVTATVRDAAGNVLHSVTNTYAENLFVQTSSTAFLGFSLGNDESIEIAFTGGGLIAYGATIDNVSNDPSAQFLSYVTVPQLAQRAEPSRGGSSTPLKLALILAMLGVGAGMVLAKR